MKTARLLRFSSSCALLCTAWLAVVATADASIFNSDTAGFAAADGQTSHTYINVDGSGVNITVSTNSANATMEQSAGDYPSDLYGLGANSAGNLYNEEFDADETLKVSFTWPSGIAAPVTVTSLTIGNLHHEGNGGVDDTAMVTVSATDFFLEASFNGTTTDATWTGPGTVTQPNANGQDPETTVSGTDIFGLGAISVIDFRPDEAADSFAFIELEFTAVGIDPGLGPGGGVATPEPSTFLLTGLMLLGVGGRVWYRRRQRANS